MKKQAQIGCIQEKNSASLRKFFDGFFKVLPSAAQNVLPNVVGASKSLRPENTWFSARFYRYDTVFNEKKQFFTPDSKSFFINLFIVKNRKKVKNGQKPVFTVANSTVLTGFEQHNLKKHDA